MRHLGVWGFALLHALVACSNSSSSTPADGGTGPSSGTGGAATGGASGASSGGSSGASRGGSSGSNTGGSSGTATGGRSSGGSTNTGGTTDAGAKDATGDPSHAHTDGGDSCSACKRGELCVEHITEGGFFIPVDAGRCPKGRIPESLGPGRGSDCTYAPSYECRSLPSECTTPPGSTAVAHCTCAASFCAAPYQCTDVTPTLMQCVLRAP